MEQQEQLVLGPLLHETFVKSRKLLPVWIKVFIWLFMITGALVPFIFLFGFAGWSFQVALYGLESNTPLNTIGVAVSALFLLKGIAAFALWMEKDWAIVFAIVDAIIGIAVCVFVMLIYPSIYNMEGFNLNIRLELLLLIPYLLKLQKIKPSWERTT